MIYLFEHFTVVVNVALLVKDTTTYTGFSGEILGRYGHDTCLGSTLSAWLHQTATERFRLQHDVDATPTCLVISVRRPAKVEA